MAKHDFFSPKAIGNRIKAKGLQKLRWYCQVCQKQCRDEAGYRNHCLSESHQRKILLFSENSSRNIEGFSQQFMQGFMAILSKRYGTRRVFANQVYQEYISQRDHLHMNATRWATLAEFVMYLGRRGLVKVDEGERGFFIQWIDNSPKELSRQAAIQKMDRQNKDQEERDRLLIEEQIARGKEAAVANSTASSDIHGFDRSKLAGGKIAISLKPKNKKMVKLGDSAKTTTAKRPIEDEPESSAKAAKIADDDTQVESSYALDNDEEEEEEEPWILPGIIVKVMTSKLAEGRYYRKNGTLESIIDDYIAEIRMLESGDVIRVDQSQLETVIPPVGGTVVLLRRPWRSQTAELVSVDIDSFSATLKLLDNGEELMSIGYESFSKATK